MSTTDSFSSENGEHSIKVNHPEIYERNNMESEKITHSLSHTISNSLHSLVREPTDAELAAVALPETSIYPDQETLNELSRTASKRVNEEGDVIYDNEFEVGITAGDKYDMTKISQVRKWIVLATLCLAALNITMLSSCWSMAAHKIMAEFNVSHEVAVLGISLYIWALGTGPLFLSPISEYHGRRITYLASLSLAAIFQLLTAFCHNLGGMLFGRVMTAFFGSAFMSVASGTISDLFDKREIGLPLSIYSLTPFLGPSFGPLIAGYVVQSGADYRWIFYSLMMMTACVLVLVYIFVPETYKPLLCVYKAKELRKSSGVEEYYAPLERAELTLFQSMILSAKRPLELLFKDPMMFVLCFYTGLVLAIVYLFFISFPYTFSTVWGFDVGSQGLAFMGLAVGLSFSSLFSKYFTVLYLKLVERNNGVAEPEFRFPALIVGGCITPIGLFILAWVSYSKLHWIGALFGAGIYGVGTSFVFQGVMAYTVDGYRLYAASAVAANCFLRSLMAGVFPLFGLQMYEKLGVHWASSLLGFLTLLILPAPVFFFKYGKRLRARSPYAWSD